MRKLIERIRGVRLRMRETWGAARRHWFASLFLGLAGIGGGAAGEMYFSEVMLTYFPDYFTSDTQQIVDHQRENFDSLQRSIKDLKGALEGEKEKAMMESIESKFADAQEKSRSMSAMLKAMRQENVELRHLIKKQFDLEPGVDFRMEGPGTLRMDELHMFVISQVWGDDEVVFYINSPVKDKDRKVGNLDVGENFHYTKANGEYCSVTYLGPKEGLHEFGMDCLPPKKIEDKKAKG